MQRAEQPRFSDFGLPYRVQKQLENLWDTLRGTVNETMQFNLAHVFGRELLHIIDQNIQEEALLPELTKLMEHQIKVFAQEALGPSIHPPYNVSVDRKRWQQGEIDLHDERYLQKNGMLDMSRMAVLTASSPAEKKRYQLETQQIETAIYPWVSQTLHSATFTLLPASPAEQQWMSRTLKHTTNALMVGEKMAYFLPKNKIYAEDLAFINFCQLVYVPGSGEDRLSPSQIRQRLQSGSYSGKLSIVIEPVLGDIKNEDLAKLTQHWKGEKSAPSKAMSTEEALMTQLHHVPEWAGEGVGREFILGALAQVLEDTHPILTQANERQQRVENIMEEQKWNITQGATFLAEILASELATFSRLTPEQQRRFAAKLPLRLHYAFGLVASPLLQRQAFDANIAKTAYARRFPRHSSNHDSQEPIQVTDTMREMMADPAWLRDAKHVRLNKTEQELTTASLTGLPSYYLNRVVSNTACNIFSFGGYAEQISLLNSPGAFSIMSGMPVADSNLWQKYYPHMELSGVGVCVSGESCRVRLKTGRDMPQMLGPCGVCLSCQMYDDMLNLGQDPNRSPLPDSAPLSLTHFSDAVQHTTNALRGSIQPNDILPNFLTPENKITLSTQPWR